MTEEIKEIKEILDKLKYIVDFPIIEHDTSFNSDNVEESVCLLISNECQLLLDYITNLQQENKEYSMIFDTFSKRPYAHKYLEEKKKELNNNKIIGLDSEMVYKDYYDYKSRCEKANKIITDFMCTEEYCSVDPVAIAENYMEIQKALNGSDKSE